MSIRKDFARKGIRAAHKAANGLGLGPVGTSLVVGAGSALGAAVPYVFGGVALRLMGFKTLGSLAFLAGSLDMTGMEVALSEGDRLDPDYTGVVGFDFDRSEPNKDIMDWYDSMVEQAYREEKG